MRSPRGSLVGVLILLAAGCDNFDNFDVPVSGRVTIPGRSALDDILGTFPEVSGLNSFDVSQSAEFQNGGHDPDDVDSIVLERLVLRVVEPRGADLSFLCTAILSLQTEGRAMP